MDNRLSAWRLGHLFLGLLLLIGCGKKEETKMPANPAPRPGGSGATGGPTSTDLPPPPPPEPP
jgi:hypothetical protein